MCQGRQATEGKVSGPSDGAHDKGSGSPLGSGQSSSAHCRGSGSPLELGPSGGAHDKGSGSPLGSGQSSGAHGRGSRGDASGKDLGASGGASVKGVSHGELPKCVEEVLPDDQVWVTTVLASERVTTQVDNTGALAELEMPSLDMPVEKDEHEVSLDMKNESATAGAKETVNAQTIEEDEGHIVLIHDPSFQIPLATEHLTVEEKEYLDMITGSSEDNESYGIVYYKGSWKDQGKRRTQQEEIKMKFGNENDSNAINRPTGEQGARLAGEPSTRKRKLYEGFDFNLVKGRGGRKQETRGPSPLRKGEPIDLSSESDSSKRENGSPRKKQRMDEVEPNEVVDLKSGEEDDEITTPTKEVRARDEDPADEKDKWIKEFGPSCSDRFDQWSSIMRYEWAIKGKEKLSRGEDITPTTLSFK
ncbi:hypothetical protein CBR_g32663 [Chara braunii]|uniref:Uncharacterized protein n=1 Tax=Chara braunii TaxID=69332 RepID=A0A388LH73_CHABU|nr:hypothetical protein CBR_g32663 [Chara braunii]|eukprot:GBG81668.1 hypothetical protein CBR_g32663 [Chara braunii]